MANLKGTNPANSGDGKALAVGAKVHRLDRSPSIASDEFSYDVPPMPAELQAGFVARRFSTTWTRLVFGLFGPIISTRIFPYNTQVSLLVCLANQFK